MKKYINNTREVYLAAVHYFTSAPTKKAAEEILKQLTPEELEKYDTLIAEFGSNGWEFFRNFYK